MDYWLYEMKDVCHFSLVAQPSVWETSKGSSSTEKQTTYTDSFVRDVIDRILYDIRQSLKLPFLSWLFLATNLYWLFLHLMYAHVLFMATFIYLI